MDLTLNYLLYGDVELKI